MLPPVASDKSGHRAPATSSMPMTRSKPPECGTASTRVVGPLRAAWRANRAASVEVPTPPAVPVTAMVCPGARGEGRPAGAVRRAGVAASRRAASAASSSADCAGMRKAWSARTERAVSQSTGSVSSATKNRCSWWRADPSRRAVSLSTITATARGKCRPIRSATVPAAGSSGRAGKRSDKSTIGRVEAAAMWATSGWSIGSVTAMSRNGSVFMSLIVAGVGRERGTEKKSCG